MILLGCMAEFGDVRYSREVRGTIWTQFREGGREDTHKIKAFFLVVGPLRFNPPYTNDLVVHATFFVL